MDNKLEITLQDLLEKGLIEGYEILPAPTVKVRIFVSKKTRNLEEKLKQALGNIPFEIEETGPIEAL